MFTTSTKSPDYVGLGQKPVPLLFDIKISWIYGRSSPKMLGYIITTNSLNNLHSWIRQKNIYITSIYICTVILSSPNIDVS